LSRNRSPTIFPLGVRCLSRVPGFASARSPLLRHAPRRRHVVSEPCGTASREVLAPTNAFTSGAPSPPLSPLRGLAWDEGRQALVGAVLRVLPLSTVPASTRCVSRSLDPAVCRVSRRFAAFFHAARVPGASLQSFPFPGSRTRSRGPPAHLRVRVRPPPAQSSREIHDRFRRTRQALCPAEPTRRRTGTHEPGRWFLAVASPVASTRLSAPHVPSTSLEHWARRLTAGTPASEPCSPRESVLQQPYPWPGWGRPSVLSWDPYPSEPSPQRFRVRSLASTHAAGTSPVPRAPPSIQPSR